MSNDESNLERGSESTLMPVVLGVLVTVGLAAVSFAILPLFGRESGFWGLASVMPLLALAGGALALTQYSLSCGGWQAFRSDKLRYLVLFGVPFTMLGLTNGDPALWLAGAVGLLIGLVGLRRSDGWLRGLRRCWRLLLLSALLGVVAGGLWLLFGQDNGPELDEYGCLVGQQEWCEFGQKCVIPWAEHCGDSKTVDSFNILKKVRNFSSLDLSRPVQDEFTWIEDRGDELVGLYVPGLTSHVEGANLAQLEQAFVKAELKPSEVNSEDIETGGLRGYRYLDIVVCSASFAESTRGVGVDIGVSCGPLAEAIPE